MGTGASYRLIPKAAIETVHDMTKLESRIVYQIYPRTFADSDGDGTGDIKGIISRLGNIAELGVNTIWLSPVYCSPGFDNGYDISDYCSVDPLLGSMEDMDELIAKARDFGIGIVMDLVINHTSDKHEWFIKSKDRNSRYRSYYFWRETEKLRPPNNWTSFFGGSAWTYDEEGGGHYLHLFAKQQPDLDYHDPEVLAEIKRILRFWLDKGIIGFRCDVINIIWKDSLADGRRSLILTGMEHYLSRGGAHDILKELRRDVFSKYDCFTVGETVFVDRGMAGDLCGKDRGELDMVFAFEHMETDQVIVKWFKTRFRPEKFFRVISKWQQALEWNANYLENHDQPRSISRFINDEEFRIEGAKALAMLLLTLRGTPYIYQGQEVGTENRDFHSMDDIKDVESHNIYALARRIGFPGWLAWRMIRRTTRDHARGPVDWTANNDLQDTYHDLIKFRKELPVLISGAYKEIFIKGDLFVFERSIENGNKDSGEKDPLKMRIAINLGKKPVRYSVEMKVFFSTTGRDDYDGVIRPYEGIMFG